jgi:hypothetical protein
MSNIQLETTNTDGQMTKADWDRLTRLKAKPPTSYQDIRDAVNEFEGQSKGKKQRTW